MYDKSFFDGMGGCLFTLCLFALVGVGSAVYGVASLVLWIADHLQIGWQ